ncbi:MAG: hypothetical protein HC936_16335 [Leptolyngbyaceae cyanobacterium SU_3_3]|nr:hypothetical protein [Leptolyngbyaceae cyanobacterium SU_3_3]
METSPSTFGLILDPKIADLSGRHSNYQPDAVHQDLKDLQPILLIYARKSGVSRQIRLHLPSPKRLLCMHILLAQKFDE